jgi:hypothetical protein
MKLADLTKELQGFYTREKFHEISTGIIQLHKENSLMKFSYLFSILNAANNVPGANISNKELFLKLINFFHPDRLAIHIKEIEKFTRAGNREKLENYLAIIRPLLNLKYQKESHSTPEKNSESQYNSENIWVYGKEDFAAGYSKTFEDIHEHSHLEEREIQDSFYEDDEIDILTALKRMEYGNLDIQLMPHHLEELDYSLELGDWEISSLNGIEYCRNIEKLDLSENKITNLTKLRGLVNLRELYLASNQIDDISPLRSLLNLELLDLAQNSITDIKDLEILPRLRFLNIQGNDIPTVQITPFTEREVIVIQ